MASPNYQVRWRKNPEWTKFFAPAGEIQEYLKKTCEEEEMWVEINPGHRVKEATWI